MTRIIAFKRNNPKFVKRLLMDISKNKVIIWTNKSNDLLLRKWKEMFGTSLKLRIVPRIPVEGGSTQEYYNSIWDKSRYVCPGIRSVYAEKENMSNDGYMATIG